jgi:hypothetical protein
VLTRKNAVGNHMESIGFSYGNDVLPENLLTG